MRMSTNNIAPPPPASLPFHLSGNHAPVLQAFTATALPVTGTLPADLNGT